MATSKKPTKTTPSTTEDVKQDIELQELMEQNAALEKALQAAKDKAEQERQWAALAKIETTAYKHIVDTYQKLESRAKNTAEDVAGFGEKINKLTSRKWVGVGLLLLLAIAAIWIVRLWIQRDMAQREVLSVKQAYSDTVAWLREDIEGIKQEKREDSLRLSNEALLKNYDAERGEEEKKNSSRSKVIVNTKSKLDAIQKKFPADTIPSNDSMRRIMSEVLTD